MPKITKTSFQDELSFRFDLLGGNRLIDITRELSKKRKILPNVSNDKQSMSWVWRGAGVEGDPYYWVKVNAVDITTFCGFFVGAENWNKFRREVRDAILGPLSGIETDFIANLTSIYAWIVPQDELGRLSALMTFSHLVITENLEQPERFSTLLVNPKTKQRVLFESTPESLDESRLTLSVQTNQFEDSLAKVFDQHFAFTDAAYNKANSFIESVFEK